MERVATGIPGLDELIEGGFPKGSTILVSGSAGTGKTILSMQYLYAGATQYNEKGVFVSLESNIDNLIWNMESFGWKLKELQQNQKLSIYRLRIGEIFEPVSIREQISKELDHIAEIVKTIDAKRLVIDPTTAFGIWFERAMLRNVLFNFTDKIRELGCTTILTSETKNRKDEFSAFGVEEFIADGVI
ncbi:MAG: AAA family ATPase, partial [Candidatus Diapherotrites archaeon]|nr:AAA family ATPase [Candidatus Diapherotrites archaeon]